MFAAPASTDNGITSIAVPLQEKNDDQLPVPSTARVAERLCWLWISSHSSALKRDGWKINHKRVERVMRQVGLTCKRKPRYVHTTDSKHGEPVYPNVIPRYADS
jgi:transposase InsO family protein